MYKEAIKKKADFNVKNIKLNVMKKNKKFNNYADMIKESWEKIAPFWSLKNIIAVNPLKGFEGLPIEEAVRDASVFFQQKSLPKHIESINRETIKWLQAFLDEGQATIEMPFRKQGFYRAWKRLAYFDQSIHKGESQKKEWLLNLPLSSTEAIFECLLKLKIKETDQSLFLILMLTTLPGWASYIKYRTQWAQEQSAHQYSIVDDDYMAVRLIITVLMWENAAELIDWYKSCKENELKKINPIQLIEKNEKSYLIPLLNKLTCQADEESKTPEAQVVFCIDVRSEPFRRALERVGHYETFGFAGFFGIPVRIENEITKESYASCPVLLKPKHTVSVTNKKSYRKSNILKEIYQSLKYSFTTAFPLVEFMGFWTGFWMLLKTLMPNLAIKLSNCFTKSMLPKHAIDYSLESISFEEQCIYAESALKAIGLTKHFSPLVVFCGHGSATENNAYATALDCGACAGRQGGSNAAILSKILNNEKVRGYLDEKGISIPQSTYFIGAEHNTTSDEVKVYESYAGHQDDSLVKKLDKLKQDFTVAGQLNSQERLDKMDFSGNQKKRHQNTKIRSIDWAQVRPEWGLARNAAFIAGPRGMTKNINLEGRAFLHSYDYRQDLDGKILSMILTAPMVVAQWINCQYLFSTLDNVAYGAGSKITKNITGKMGVMQGNASDLMTGLPLQSVYITDNEPYHKLQRLMTIVYAPCHLIDQVIQKEPVLKNLLSNGWVVLACIDPEEKNKHYLLNRQLKWEA
jgi:uncharacterized protein YbcC (UPF0753/DUF2309 family)